MGVLAYHICSMKRRPCVPSQRSVETIESKLVLWDLRDVSRVASACVLLHTVLSGVWGRKRTEFLKLLHRLVVLSCQLGPFRKVVLGRHAAELALQTYGFSLQGYGFLCGRGCGGREFAVEYPELYVSSASVLERVWEERTYQLVDRGGAYGVDDV